MLCPIKEGCICMKSKQQDFRTERYLRYSIRKYSFGVASVVVVAGLLFLGNGVASASEQQLKETASSTEVVVANSPGSAIFEATDSSVVTAKEEKGEEIQIEEAAHKEAAHKEDAHKEAAHTEEDAHTEEAAHTEEFKREEVISQDDTSTGKQGQVQTSISGIERFSRLNDPDVRLSYYSLNGSDDGKVTVEGVGTYSIDLTGVVTFSPLPSFTGTAEGVTVQVGVVQFDDEGNLVHGFYEAHYRPTVTPVVPTAKAAESEAPQGIVQTGRVVFTAGDPIVPINKDTIALLDETVQPATSVVAKSPSGADIGIFTVDKETGLITFMLTDTLYSGEVVPAKIRAQDANGTSVETSYSPKIIPVVPSAKDATSTGKQGQEQSGKPVFIEGDSRVPMDDDTPATFDDGSKTKTITGEGIYTVGTDGTVTFVPDKSFTGIGTGVIVKRVDKNGTSVTAHYRPTVTPVVPVAPVSPVPPFTSVTPTPPVAPASPATPVTSVTPTPPATPVSPVAPEIPMTPPVESGEKEDIQGKEQTGKTSIKLPNTGTKEYTSLVSFGLFGVMSLVYLITRKRKKE